MYLDRPIFTFPINWSDPVNKSFTYDLKEVQLGFGAEYFTGMADFVAQGYEVTCDLRGDDTIAAFDAFTEALNGRLVGFWLPAPIETMQVVSAQSMSSFKIARQGLSATWQDHPDVHLYFSLPGQLSNAAAITGVVDNGDGTETVTIDSVLLMLSGVDAARLSVFRLHYVRLADDTESATFPAEGWQRRTIKVLELPEEYTAIETGEQRIFLYHFYAEAPMICDWYYTNFAAPVVSQGILFTPWQMEHGSLTRDLKLEASQTEIDAKYSADHPFALMLPIQFPKPLWVEIFSITFSDLDDRARDFFGRVVSVEDAGDQIKATCQSLVWALANKIPGPYIGPNCPWALYDKATCKLMRGAYDSTAVILAIDSTSYPPSIHVALDLWLSSRTYNHWFAQGWLDSGVGADCEMRTILDSVVDNGDDPNPNNLKLTLNAPLFKAQVGDRIQVIPGCDGSAATCQTKFHNYLNFGGFPAVPATNPALVAQQATSPGGKK